MVKKVQNQSNARKVIAKASGVAVEVNQPTAFGQAAMNLEAASAVVVEKVEAFNKASQELKQAEDAYTSAELAFNELRRPVVTAPKLANGRLIVPRKASTLPV